MKNSALIAALLFMCALGCQSPRHAQWLTPPRGEGEKTLLGQSPTDDPFLSMMKSAPAPPVAQPTLDPFSPVQQTANVPNTAAADAEREHMIALATTPRTGAPDYLKPFNHWDGPFKDRSRRKNTEQEIIQQVGMGIDFENVSIKTLALA